MKYTKQDIADREWFLNATHDEKIAEIKNRVDELPNEDMIAIIFFLLGNLIRDDKQ